MATLEQISPSKLSFSHQGANTPTMHKVMHHEESIEVTEFLTKIKSISDSWISISELVTTQEQLDVILEGLPLKFVSLCHVDQSQIWLIWIQGDQISFTRSWAYRVDKMKSTPSPSSNSNPPTSNQQVSSTQEAIKGYQYAILELEGHYILKRVHLVTLVKVLLENYILDCTQLIFLVIVKIVFFCL